jgi:hypothetical protein
MYKFHLISVILETQKGFLPIQLVRRKRFWKVDKIKKVMSTHFLRRAL